MCPFGPDHDLTLRLPFRAVNWDPFTDNGREVGTVIGFLSSVDPQGSRNPKGCLSGMCVRVDSTLPKYLLAGTRNFYHRCLHTDLIIVREKSMLAPWNGAVWISILPHHPLYLLLLWRPGVLRSRHRPRHRPSLRYQQPTPTRRTSVNQNPHHGIAQPRDWRS